MKVTEAQKRALEAVAAGRVRHMHPFVWLLEVEDLAGVKARTLQTLANRKLIRVIANSAETQRPVEITDGGRAALAKANGEG